MIDSIDIISQPEAGIFEERIYDYSNPWNSQSRTYTKFTNNDHTEWCGVFRGAPRKTEISKEKSEILILTCDYLWKLDSNSGNVLEIEDQPQYHSLIVAPNGVFIIADYYNIFLIEGTLNNVKVLGSPIPMDTIKFQNWQNGKLVFDCDEFLNWKRHLVLQLNPENWSIEIKTPHNTV